VISDWVLYAKGGAAWINADYNLAASGPFGGGSVKDTRGGYALGLVLRFVITVTYFFPAGQAAR
jgi:hypothetical protein